MSFIRCPWGALALLTLAGPAALADPGAVAAFKNTNGCTWLVSVEKSDMDPLGYLMVLRRFDAKLQEITLPPRFRPREVVVQPGDLLAIETFKDSMSLAKKVTLSITLLEVNPIDAQGNPRTPVIGTLDYSFELLPGDALPDQGALDMGRTSTLDKHFQLERAPESKQKEAKPNAKDLPIWQLSPRPAGEGKATDS